MTAKSYLRLASAPGPETVPQYEGPPLTTEGFENLLLVEELVKKHIDWIVENEARIFKPPLGLRYSGLVKVATPDGVSEARLIITGGIWVLGKNDPRGKISCFDVDFMPYVRTPNGVVWAIGFSADNPGEVAVRYRKTDFQEAHCGQHTGDEDFRKGDITYLLSAALLSGCVEGLQQKFATADTPA